MGRFENYLLVSDFDRTLTNRQDSIPPENLAAIDAFLAEGGLFTVATGRSVPIFRDRARTLPINAPVIVFNGAVCYDFQRDLPLFCRSLPESCVAFVQRLGVNHPMLRIELQDLQFHYPVYTPPGTGQAHSHPDTIRHLPAAQIPQPLFKILIIGPYTPSADSPDFFVGCSAQEDRFYGEVLHFIAAEYGSQCTAIRSAPRMIEVQPVSTSKGAAARALAHHLGRSRLVCVGDAPNDLSMLLEADLPFVPANAAKPLLEQFPVVADCDAGAIASVISRL